MKSQRHRFNPGGAKILPNKVWYDGAVKRGPKPKGKVLIKWTAEFSYGIGLLVSDGCLSKDGRHINFTSKDFDLITSFIKCLGIESKVRSKRSGAGNLSYHVDFSDVLFYEFLVKIGLTPAKSKTINSVYVPDEYFFDFVRGYFDGDGCSYSYYDPIWPDSFRFYISFASGSERYLDWLRNEIQIHAGIKGFINRKRGSTNVQLKYSKKEAGILAKKMYYQDALPCLARKRIKVLGSLGIIECRSGEIGRHAAFRTL